VRCSDRRCGGTGVAAAMRTGPRPTTKAVDWPRNSIVSRFGRCPAVTFPPRCVAACGRDSRVTGPLAGDAPMTVPLELPRRSRQNRLPILECSWPPIALDPARDTVVVPPADSTGVVRPMAERGVLPPDTSVVPATAGGPALRVPRRGHYSCAR